MDYLGWAELCLRFWGALGRQIRQLPFASQLAAGRAPGPSRACMREKAWRKTQSHTLHGRRHKTAQEHTGCHTHWPMSLLVPSTGSEPPAGSSASFTRALRMARLRGLAGDSCLGGGRDGRVAMGGTRTCCMHDVWQMRRSQRVYMRQCMGTNGCAGCLAAPSEWCAHTVHGCTCWLAGGACHGGRRESQATGRSELNGGPTLGSHLALTWEGGIEREEGGRGRGGV